MTHKGSRRTHNGESICKECRESNRKAARTRLRHRARADSPSADRGPRRSLATGHERAQALAQSAGCHVDHLCRHAALAERGATGYPARLRWRAHRRSGLGRPPAALLSMELGRRLFGQGLPCGRSRRRWLARCRGPRRRLRAHVRRGDQPCVGRKRVVPGLQRGVSPRSTATSSARIRRPTTRRSCGLAPCRS
jgi:hypothetical protein